MIRSVMVNSETQNEQELLVLSCLVTKVVLSVFKKLKHIIVLFPHQ